MEKRFPGPVFLDFGVHFGVSFGALGISFSQLLEFFFKGWFWSDFEDAFWMGRRTGRGPWNLNFEGFGTLPYHARLPLQGCGEYLKASPLPPAPET